MSATEPVSFFGIPIEYVLLGRDGREYRLGQIVVSRGAAELIRQTRGGSKKVSELLRRHAVGDCPTLDPADQAMNQHGVQTNGYLMTVWDLIKGARRIWIITEQDRSTTTILTPDDY